MVATSTEVGNLVTTTAGLVDPLSCCLLVGRMVKVVGSPLVVMSALSASVGGWSRWVPALVLVILILSGMEAFFRRSTIPWQSFTSGPSITSGDGLFLCCGLLGVGFLVSLVAEAAFFCFLERTGMKGLVSSWSVSSLGLLGVAVMGAGGATGASFSLPLGVDTDGRSFLATFVELFLFFFSAVGEVGSGLLNMWSSSHT